MMMKICWYTILLTASLTGAGLVHVFSGPVRHISQKLEAKWGNSGWEAGMDTILDMADSLGGVVSTDLQKTFTEGWAAFSENLPGSGESAGLVDPSEAKEGDGMGISSNSDNPTGLGNTSRINGAADQTNPTGSGGSAGSAIPSGPGASASAESPAAPPLPSPAIKANGESPAPTAPMPKSQGQDSSQLAPPAPDADFSGVLFIGDSRTAGLSEYGNLGEAQVFANSGMTVYSLFNAKETVKDKSKQTLEQVLSQNQYSTIYLMLGINELGYDYQRTVSQYKSVVARIQELQPQARLVLEANLHVTREKSAKSPIYNNAKIDALNQAVKQIAEDSHLYYIDVNELFDDENGNLNPIYSTDGSHVLGKYYSKWADWIRKGG